MSLYHHAKHNCSNFPRFLFSLMIFVSVSIVQVGVNGMDLILVDLGAHTTVT